MNTSKHIDALRAAIAEARANIHECNRCDCAVLKLVKETTPWWILNNDHGAMRDILRDPSFRVIDVRERWSWRPERKWWKHWPWKRMWDLLVEER